MEKRKFGGMPLFLRMMTWIVGCWFLLLSVTLAVTLR